MACEAEPSGDRVTFRIDTYQPHPYDLPDIENPQVKILTIRRLGQSFEDPSSVEQYIIAGDSLQLVEPDSQV